MLCGPVGGSAGVSLIAAERRRQVTKEGWTPEHDDREHDQGELALAGACYAVAEMERDVNDDNSHPSFWPFAAKWWKPTPNDRKRELVKAGALIAAELDRLLREESREAEATSA